MIGALISLPTTSCDGADINYSGSTLQVQVSLQSSPIPRGERAGQFVLGDVEYEIEMKPAKYYAQVEPDEFYERYDY